MKINVVGTSGSGKSYFSEKLAEKLNIPYIEMDEVYWLANWNEPTNEVYFEKLEKVLSCDHWVLDGNYSRTQAIKWQHVETIIWVDYSFARTLYQAALRAINRALTRKELWAGNRESWRKLLSKDSILLWTVTHYRKNKTKYQSYIDDPKYSHIDFIRIKSPKEMSKFLSASSPGYLVNPN